jgi:nucleotide-binding universal stress UspA family protein
MNVVDRRARGPGGLEAVRRAKRRGLGDRGRHATEADAAFVPRPTQLACGLHDGDVVTFKKIVCATDFSAGADHALDMAIKVAIQQDAELVIVHAWELPAYAGEVFASPALLEGVLEDDERLVAKAVRHAHDRGVARASGKQLRGVGWQIIVELAKADPAIDLIVVGTHGRTGIRRVLLGSVAQKIVRSAPVSVLAVHPEDRIEPLGLVLWPTDLSEAAAYAGELAASLIDAPGGVMERVHVIEKPRGLERSAEAVAIVEDLERRGSELLERSLPGLGGSIRVTRRAIAGHPSGELLALLDEERYDLVAVGSHGRKGLAQLWLGSIAELLVRHAHCPVLVARVRA